MEQEIQKHLKVAKNAALKAGKYLADNFGKKHTANFKSKNDVGLAVDIESERIILDILKEKFPTHNFYSEEFGKVDNNSKYTWVIDPLDGTNNYFASIPYFSVSIALLLENEIIVGIVYNPVSNQFFEATQNGGAFLNGNRIESSLNDDFKKSVCSFIQGHMVATSEHISKEANAIKNQLSKNSRRVLTTWAPALDWALLAYGGIDVLVSFESEVEDMYAGLLIAKEAGVKIKNFKKNDFRIGDKRVVASNELLYEKTLKIIIN